MPLICISGAWLKDAGFIIGDEVSIEVKNYGELVIKLMQNEKD